MFSQSIDPSPSLTSSCSQTSNRNPSRASREIIDMGAYSWALHRCKDVHLSMTFLNFHLLAYLYSPISPVLSVYFAFFLHFFSRCVPPLFLWSTSSLVNYTSQFSKLTFQRIRGFSSLSLKNSPFHSLWYRVTSKRRNSIAKQRAQSVLKFKSNKIWRYKIRSKALEGCRIWTWRGRNRNFK